MTLPKHYKEQKGYLGEIVFHKGRGDYGKSLYLIKAAVFLRATSIRLIVLDADVSDFEGSEIYFPYPLGPSGYILKLGHLHIANQGDVISKATMLVVCRTVALL